MNELILQRDDFDIDRYLEETENAHKVKPVANWRDELLAEFSTDPKAPTDTPLAFMQSRVNVQLRPGEVSLWFGFNGHGKSLLLGEAMLGIAAHGEKACIASFEMQPRKTLARMCRQWTDMGRPDEQGVDDFVAWAVGKLWVYDQTGSVDPRKLYAVIRYAATELQVNHFVVDNLTKCVQADEDYAGQKQIVDKLSALAQAFNIHIHLVHHAKKAQDESKPPRKMDALGASAITNLVDNVFIVWRNKAKYEADDVDPNKADAMFICDKQRHGTGWEGVQNLTYHQRSQQFIPFGTLKAMDFRTQELLP